MSYLSVLEITDDHSLILYHIGNGGMLSMVHPCGTMRGLLCSCTIYFLGDVCDVVEKSYPDHDSLEFWRSIEESSDFRTRCHKKVRVHTVYLFRHWPNSENFNFDSCNTSKTINFTLLVLGSNFAAYSIWNIHWFWQ